MSWTLTLLGFTASTNKVLRELHLGVNSQPHMCQLSTPHVFCCSLTCCCSLQEMLLPCHYLSDVSLRVCPTAVHMSRCDSESRGKCAPGPGRHILCALAKRGRGGHATASPPSLHLVPAYVRLEGWHVKNWQHVASSTGMGGGETFCARAELLECLMEYKVFCSLLDAARAAAQIFAEVTHIIHCENLISALHAAELHTEKASSISVEQLRTAQERITRAHKKINKNVQDMLLKIAKMEKYIGYDDIQLDTGQLDAVFEEVSFYIACHHNIYL